jgi:hypothetical protein
MNTISTRSTHIVRRRVAACVAVAAVLPALAACGADVKAPTQDIGRHQVSKPKHAVPGPTRTTRNRYDFRDEAGTAGPAPRRSHSATRGTRNRMDFRDDGW